MTAPLIELADGIVTELNAQSWTQTFTATRVYSPVVDLKDLKTLSVMVMPRGVATTIDARGRVGLELSIVIGIRKALTALTNAVVDPLLNFADEITEHFRFLNFNPVGSDTAKYVGDEMVTDENWPAFSTEDLETQRQFTSLHSYTYHLFQ